jgi:hypothetical protein
VIEKLDLDLDLDWLSSNSRRNRRPAGCFSSLSGCFRKCPGNEKIPVEDKVEVQVQVLKPADPSARWALRHLASQQRLEAGVAGAAYR